MLEAATARTECFLLNHFSNLSKDEVTVAAISFAGGEARSLFFFFRRGLFLLLFLKLFCLLSLALELLLELGCPLKEKLNRVDEEVNCLLARAVGNHVVLETLDFSKFVPLVTHFFSKLACLLFHIH